MGRRKQMEPPIPATYLAEAFEVRRRRVALARTRAGAHFPERPEDVANFNARFAGRPAGFLINGSLFVRLQWRGRTRRMSALRVAWILATGAHPVGVVEARNGNEADLSPANLIERSRGWRRFGGLSRAQRRASDAAVLAAMRDDPNASIAQLSALVGSDTPCVCRRLVKLAEAGLTCGPMCVPSLRWHLTGKGAEIAASERPMLDDLDRDILRTIAQRDHIAAASVARRVEGKEMTARRRLRSLAERGLVINGDGYSLTEAGRALVGSAEPQTLASSPTSSSAALCALRLRPQRAHRHHLGGLGLA